MSTERILVDQGILEPFTQAFKQSITDMFDSAPTPPILAQLASIERNKRLISSAFTAGATLIHGGGDERTSTYRMIPTVVGGVTRKMEIFHRESFGPSVSLIGIGGDAEAIAMANDTEYGLTGAVFSKNLSRALSIAQRIESGAVHINSMTVHDEAGLPHGGIKNSGWGRFNAQVGLEEFLKTKTITFQY
jgi:acyl-CoA reductase-like NAD-dependent aldehyde dehydrogenase